MKRRFDPGCEPSGIRSGMKGVMWMAVFILIPWAGEAQIPIIGLLTGAAKKVVMALDLQVQQDQTGVIESQAAQQAMTNAMQDQELAGIGSWVDQLRQLYADYYTALWTVKEVMLTYKAVKDCIQREGQIVAQYKQISAEIRRDAHFSPGELNAMQAALDGVLKESVSNLNRLTTVIESFVLQVTDGARLDMIDETGSQMEEEYARLGTMNQQFMLLSMERASDANDLAATRVLYGLE